MLPEKYDLLDGWDYLPEFYAACVENGIQLGFTVGTLVERDNLERRLWSKPARYFYRLPQSGYPGYYTKPQGMYVVGTEFADYGHTDALYQKLFSYMEEHDLVICGNAYEEYLIDEVAEEDASAYLL